MTGPRRFDASELGTDRPDELEDALTAAGWLDAAVDVAPVAPSAAFADRVMTALANEPAPSPVGFMAPVRRRGLLAGFGASVKQAWASVGGGGRPFLARATALAYVLAVVIAGSSLAGVATVGIAGALGMLGPSETQSAPPSPGPIVSPLQSAPPVESLPPSVDSVPPTPGESEEPSESPEGSDDHGGGGAGASDDHGDDGDEPSDDHGSGSGSDDDASESDDSDSGPGSDSDSDTESSETPRPSKTPKPSETPH